MKEQSTGEAENYPKAVQGDRFTITFDRDFWLAHNPDDYLSGFIIFNKLTGKHHAWVSVIHMMFPRLAKAGFKLAEDCPVDENRYPKADFLMLLAIRSRFKEPCFGSDFVASGWRAQAFRKRGEENELLTGKPVSASKLAHWARFTKSKTEFEKVAADWLMAHVRHDNACEILARFGNWIKLAEDIENEEIPPHYARFFAAVEEATRNAPPQVVPCKKDVQGIYERGMSGCQLGEGQGFRAVMRHLHFDWLPAGRRGPNQQQQKSGIS
jgi:hypothetical protein